MVERTTDLALPDGNSPKNDDVVNQYSNQDEFDPRAHFALSGWAKAPKSSSATASTLVGSHNSNLTCSRGTIQSSLRDFPESQCVWSNMCLGDSWNEDAVECDSLDGSSLKRTCIGTMTRIAYCLMYNLRLFFRTIRSHPYIPLSTLLVFAALVALGYTVIITICNSSEMEKKTLAISEAKEAGAWFADQFSNALLPLYALQQAITHSEYFKDLSNKIGQYGAQGSAPITHGPQHKHILNYRNVTGICDVPSVVEKFHDIVESIKNNFDTDGVVVNYRLAPNNVFCLAEPLVNSEDFGANKVLNSKGDIGKDLLYTPGDDWLYRLRSTYSSTGNPIYIQGPTNFSQNGVNLSPELFCAHLAVKIPGYNMTIDGTSFGSWGFVMSLIDWSKLKKKSEIFKRFKNNKIEFHLYRNDINCSPGENDINTKITTIASSDNWGALTAENSVDVVVKTPNDEWINRVGYVDGFRPSWYCATMVSTILLAFLVSIMFMTILIERQLHKQLLFKIMPESAVRKIHRGQTVIERFNLVTIFFSDIVDFTSMAGEMRPIQIMEMLNELYTSFDSIVEKYDVYKVETIGDAYMVVGGAPNRTPAPEAAEQVALFAIEATEFVEKFKTSLGDQIFIRVGIASGPAVAGVVGTSMPRYCFFGDTVNFASRMESTSRTMRIQCSDLTCRLLNDAPHYVFNVEQRRDNGIIGVEMKGRGHVNSWWINGATKIDFTKKLQTDVEIGKQLLSEQASPMTNIQLETIPGRGQGVAQHDIPQLRSSFVSHDTHLQFEATTGQAWSKLGQDEGHLVAATTERDIMVDRLASILEIRLIAVIRERNQTPLNNVTRRELRAYVAHIESLYNHVEYHSFEHASHVTISMNKLITAKYEHSSSSQHSNKNDQESCQNAFISFMMVYSALVHDVCHTGRSNKILQDQNEELYQHLPAPLAEHLSINTAVKALEMNEFSNLKTVIIPTIDIKIEFGKVLFCAILCTDVASQDRLKEVKERFDHVNTNYQDIVHDSNSSENAQSNSIVLENFNQRLCPLLPHLEIIHHVLSLSEEDIEMKQHRFITTSTSLEKIVAIEHLMQVADVAHCMQGWENFIKWNYRLYREFMDCHKHNLISEPSQSWASGQIGFINNYILPLAERTETCCGSVANLNLVQSAKDNRLRWENEGQFITAIFISADNSGEDEKTVLEKCFARR